MDRLMVLGSIIDLPSLGIRVYYYKEIKGLAYC